MNKHFRTAVLTVILAGGTLTSYAVAYAVMAVTAAPASATVSSSDMMATAAKHLSAGQTDMSVREACSLFEGSGARTQCMQHMSGSPRPVRVIDFASSDTNSVIR